MRDGMSFTRNWHNHVAAESLCFLLTREHKELCPLSLLLFLKVKDLSLVRQVLESQVLRRLGETPSWHSELHHVFIRRIHTLCGHTFKHNPNRQRIPTLVITFMLCWACINNIVSDEKPQRSSYSHEVLCFPKINKWIKTIAPYPQISRV